MQNITTQKKRRINYVGEVSASISGSLIQESDEEKLLGVTLDR